MTKKELKTLLKARNIKTKVPRTKEHGYKEIPVEQEFSGKEERRKTEKELYEKYTPEWAKTKNLPITGVIIED